MSFNFIFVLTDAFSISFLKSEFGISKIVRSKLFNSWNFFIALICEVAFIPPLITFAGLFMFVFDRDKKVISFNKLALT